MELPARDPEVLLTYDGFVRALARSLVSDTHSAEDVAQQVWTAALVRGPKDRRSLRAWLAALVRNLAFNLERGERSRARREQAVARKEAIPSAHEILQREAARRSVVNAVLELDDPYRSTVLLRYFENLPPRAIAETLGVPIETVRTRTKRALDQLRAKLDREHGGDRRAWSAALLSLARLETAVPLVPPMAGAVGGAFITGVLIVSTKLKLALAGVLLLGSSVAAWSLGLGGEPGVPDTSLRPRDPGAVAAAEATAGSEGSAPSSVRVREAESPRRVETVPAPEPPPEGSLLVRTIWAADKTPAADIGVQITAWGGPNPRSETLAAVSGADGACRIASVPAGRVTIILDRGGISGASVEPLKETETTLEIAVGCTVLGTVVDPSGQPVAGAEIWLSDFSGGLRNGRVVGRAAADGTFRIRDVESGRWVGARASGFAPSPALRVSGSKGGSVELRIVLSEPGGEVAGVVLDPLGKPVPSAAVSVGAEPIGQQFTLADGSHASGPVPLETRTGPDGRFLVRGVRTGKLVVDVRGRRLAPWKGSVEVSAGTCAFLEVQLSPGVTLAGTVQDGAGNPVKGAEVGVGGRHGSGALSEAFTDAQGRFRLDALAPGEIAVRVTTDKKGKAEKRFSAADGEELRWDVVLSIGLELKGRVLETSGAPLGSWSVEVAAESGRAEDSFRGRGETDGEGRFRVPNCKDVPLRLVIYDPKGNYIFPALVRSGIRPGGEEVVLRIPPEARSTAFITGVVVDAADKPIGSAAIAPLLNGSGVSPSLTNEEGTGRFRVGPITPGTYRLSIKARGFPDLRTEEHVLAPGATWDLGNVRLLAGGTVSVSVRNEDGSLPPGSMSLSVQAAGRGGAQSITVENGAGRSAALFPGTYRLHVTGKAFACQVIPVEVRSGEDTRIEVTLRPGIARTIRLDEPGAADAARTGWLVVRDASGRCVLDASLWRRREEPLTFEACFVPGEYRLEARTAAGLRGETTFRVDPKDAADTVAVGLW